MSFSHFEAYSGQTDRSILNAKFTTFTAFISYYFFLSYLFPVVYVITEHISIALYPNYIEGKQCGQYRILHRSPHVITINDFRDLLNLVLKGIIKISCNTYVLYQNRVQCLSNFILLLSYGHTASDTILYLDYPPSIRLFSSIGCGYGCGYRKSIFSKLQHPLHGRNIAGSGLGKKEPLKARVVFSGYGLYLLQMSSAYYRLAKNDSYSQNKDFEDIANNTVKTVDSIQFIHKLVILIVSYYLRIWQCSTGDLLGKVVLHSLCLNRDSIDTHGHSRFGQSVRHCGICTGEVYAGNAE